jgi:hypothetical protein
LRAELQGTPLESGTYSVMVRSAGTDPGKDLRLYPGELDEEGRLEFVIFGSGDGGATIEYQFLTSWLRDGAIVQHSTEWRRAQRPSAPR